MLRELCRRDEACSARDRELAAVGCGQDLHERLASGLAGMPAQRHAVDRELRALNSDYDAKRSHDLALELPVVRAVPQNTFYHWLKSKGRLGGQNKVPRLSNDRNYIEEILQVAAGNH